MASARRRARIDGPAGVAISSLLAVGNPPAMVAANPQQGALQLPALGRLSFEGSRETAR